MPIKYTKSGKVAGTAQDLINLTTSEMLKLNRDELAKVVTKLGNVFNKRLPRLEKQGSLAATNVMKGGGKFQAQGKNLNELRKEYARIKAFADDKSSTVKGTIQIRKEFAERLKVKPKNAKEFEDLWEVYNKLDELHGPFSEMGRYLKTFDSNQVQKDIAERIEMGKNMTEIFNELNKKYKEAYEKSKLKEKEEERYGWSPKI